MSLRKVQIRQQFQVLQRLPKNDCVVFSRTQAIVAAYPKNQAIILVKDFINFIFEFFYEKMGL